MCRSLEVGQSHQMGVKSKVITISCRWSLPSPPHQVGCRNLAIETWTLQGCTSSLQMTIWSRFAMLQLADVGYIFETQNFCSISLAEPAQPAPCIELISWFAALAWQETYMCTASTSVGLMASSQCPLFQSKWRGFGEQEAHGYPEWYDAKISGLVLILTCTT